MSRSRLKNTSFFFLHKHDWKLLEVFLKIPGSVPTNIEMAGLPVKNMWLWSPKHVYKHPNLSLNKPDFFTINWLGEGLRSCEKLVLKLRKNEINKRSSFRESVHLKWKNPQNLKIHKSNKVFQKDSEVYFQRKKFHEVRNFLTSSHRPDVTDVSPLQQEKGGENTTIIFFFSFFFSNDSKAFTTTPRGALSIPPAPL